MSRITEIEIAGKKYPLNFSTKAAKEISKRYDGLENIDKAFDGAVDEAIDEVVWMLGLLIEQGVCYKKITEDEDVKGLTQEELEILLGFSDLAGLKDAIIGAMASGMEREVEIESDPNTKTTQGK